MIKGKEIKVPETPERACRLPVLSMCLPRQDIYPEYKDPQYLVDRRSHHQQTELLTTWICPAY